MSNAFKTFEDALGAEQFPVVDLALRKGRHFGREDGGLYDYLVDALDFLEPFYRRYGCELIQRADGYVFLLPNGERLGQRRLSAGEMLVGQTLALMYLDPAALRLGALGPEAVLERLAGLVSAETLYQLLHPRSRRFDERLAAETVRSKVGEALRRLAELGFIDLGDEGALHLRPALMRFADPVRDQGDPGAALARLVARGEVVLGAETPDRPEAEDEDLATDDLDERPR